VAEARDDKGWPLCCARALDEFWFESLTYKILQSVKRILLQVCEPV
jgi:hypothetical protein